MTPEPRTEELAGQRGGGCASPGKSHLTGEQFGELMAGTTEAAGGELALAEAHLKACEQCAAELASMREAITLFREASNAYADEELRRRPRWILPERRSFSLSLVPAYWVAAAAMFMTALFPLQVLRHHNVPQAPAGVSSVAVQQCSQRPRNPTRRCWRTSTARSPARCQLPCRRWPIQAMTRPRPTAKHPFRLQTKGRTNHDSSIDS